MKKLCCIFLIMLFLEQSFNVLAVSCKFGKNSEPEEIIYEEETNSLKLNIKVFSPLEFNKLMKKGISLYNKEMYFEALDEFALARESYDGFSSKQKDIFDEYYFGAKNLANTYSKLSIINRHFQKEGCNAVSFYNLEDDFNGVNPKSIGEWLTEKEKENPKSSQNFSLCESLLEETFSSAYEKATAFHGSSLPITFNGVKYDGLNYPFVRFVLVNFKAKEVSYVKFTFDYVNSLGKTISDSLELNNISIPQGSYLETEKKYPKNYKIKKVQNMHLAKVVYTDGSVWEK